MTTQRPVPQNEIPTNFILTDQQKQQRPPPFEYLLEEIEVYLTSGILPSGQNNYFDQLQSFAENYNLPINAFFPRPTGVDGKFSGDELLKTNSPWWFNVVPTGYDPQTRYILQFLKESGIFHYNNFISRFSNAGNVTISQDFNIFNSYLHYYPSIMPTYINFQNKIQDYPVPIPYVSDYTIVIPFYPY